MRRPVRFMKAVIVLAIVFATALYVGRVRLGDLWREATAPELPVAVSYEQTQADAEEPAPAPAEGVPSEDPAPTPVVEPEPEPEPESEPAPEEADPPVAAPVPDDPLPASINLAVPFTSQAPFGTWDALHEETCEEASLYMVHAFYEGVSGVIPPQTAEDELQRIVAIERELFGFFEDTTAAQTAKLAGAAYGYGRVDVVEDPTLDDVKGFLAAGHPVIVPAAGQMLGNPNFSGDGPPYHVFVLRGYADGNFIANDPGTRRGEAYLYPEQTIMDAIHDWTGSYDTVKLGARVVVVVYPN